MSMFQTKYRAKNLLVIQRKINNMRGMTMKSIIITCSQRSLIKRKIASLSSYRRKILLDS